MTLFSGILVYLLIWWVVIFCVLPLNIQTVNKPKDGSMPGAPVNAGIKRKLILTTVIACAVWVVIYLIIRFSGISFHDMAQGMKM